MLRLNKREQPLISPNQERVLTSLGLTSSQAKVYLVLAQNGSSKVTAISSACGIHRTHLYEALKALETDGFVEKHLETGSYTALPLKEAADCLVNNKKQELGKLETEIAEMAKVLPQKTGHQNHKNEIFLSSNKNYSFSKVYKYLSSAKVQVDQMHTWKRFIQLWATFDQTYIELTSRRVRVRQIVEAPEDTAQAKTFLKRAIFKNPLIEVRFVPKTGGNATLIDNARVLMSTSQGDEKLGETPLLFSDYKGLQGLMATYFSYMWENSEKTRPSR